LAVAALAVAATVADSAVAMALATTASVSSFDLL
jgi:hypothetical protein